MKGIHVSNLIMPLAAVLLTLGATGCKGTKALLPNVSGKAGEVMVVIDKDFWEGALGDEVRAVLTDEVPCRRGSRCSTSATCPSRASPTCSRFTATSC